MFSEDGIFSYKTEIWALGCILFELATGQVPFFEESVAKLINKIVNEELNFSRLERLNFSEEFVDIIKKMLEKVILFNARILIKDSFGMIYQNKAFGKVLFPMLHFLTSKILLYRNQQVAQVKNNLIFISS